MVAGKVCTFHYPTAVTGVRPVGVAKRPTIVEPEPKRLMRCSRRPVGRHPATSSRSALHPIRSIADVRLHVCPLLWCKGNVPCANCSLSSGSYTGRGLVLAFGCPLLRRFLSLKTGGSISRLCMFDRVSDLFN